MSISINDLEQKVLSVDDVYRQLELTEPLSTVEIDSTKDIKFHMESDWAMGLDALDNTDVVPVTMTIDGIERRMTKEAVNQAAAAHGLLAPYIKKVPATHIERLLNWHYGSGMGGAQFNVFATGDKVTAFTKQTLQPFSNLQLLERTIEGIKAQHGSDAPIYADYKFSNSFLKTNIRLITPTQERSILDGRMADVPSGEDDIWYAGVHLSNSLIGKSQTTLEAYLFRYWCTNGCTTTLKDVGTWNRRLDGQNDTVYDWAKDTVEEILGGLEYQFDQVQSLTALSTEGNTADILREIFEEYKVPVSQRDEIQNTLLAVPDTTTLYHITNAITMAANDVDLDDKRRDRLMRIGGAIPTESFDTLKAQIWREGHKASKNAPNPYEVRAI
jgi:hypothetical protein